MGCWGSAQSYDLKAVLDYLIQPLLDMKVKSGSKIINLIFKLQTFIIFCIFMLKCIKTQVPPSLCTRCTCRKAVFNDCQQFKVLDVDNLGFWVSSKGQVPSRELPFQHVGQEQTKTVHRSQKNPANSDPNGFVFHTTHKLKSVKHFLTK